MCSPLCLETFFMPYVLVWYPYVCSVGVTMDLDGGVSASRTPDMPIDSSAPKSETLTFIVDGDIEAHFLAISLVGYAFRLLPGKRDKWKHLACFRVCLLL